MQIIYAQQEVINKDYISLRKTHCIRIVLLLLIIITHTSVNFYCTLFEGAEKNNICILQNNYATKLFLYKYLIFSYLSHSAPPQGKLTRLSDKYPKYSNNIFLLHNEMLRSKKHLNLLLIN